MHEVAQDSSAKFSWSVLTNVTFFDACRYLSSMINIEI